MTKTDGKETGREEESRSKILVEEAAEVNSHHNSKKYKTEVLKHGSKDRWRIG